MSRDSGYGLSSLLLTAALVAVVVVLAGIFPFRQIIASNRAVDTAEAKLAAIREETAVLDPARMVIPPPEEVLRR